MTLVLTAGLAATATLPATPAAAQAGVTMRVDPSYQQPEFEGWGASLVWFANITGGYPDQIRNRLVDMLFSEAGLNLRTWPATTSAAATPPTYATTT